MELDFNNTCPHIDDAINSFKDMIYNQLDCMLDECNPLLSGSVKTSLINTWKDSIYNEVISLFEDTRTTNMDMRDAANTQLSNLADERDEALAVIVELEQRIEELET